jgi:hypothetical protein
VNGDSSPPPSDDGTVSSNTVQECMSRTIHCDTIGTLASFSVGLLDDREVMTVIAFARSVDDFICGTWHQEGLKMSARQARELGEALLVAARAADMGPAPRSAFS